MSLYLPLETYFTMSLYLLLVLYVPVPEGKTTNHIFSMMGTRGTHALTILRPKKVILEQTVLRVRYSSIKYTFCYCISGNIQRAITQHE